MDEYTTRELIEAIYQSMSLNRFFSRIFFPVRRTHLAELIEVDVKKGRRKMAPFVSPRRGGKVIKRDGFNTNLIRCPKIAPETVLTTEDINKRSFGENVYSRQTPQERSEEMIAKDITDLQEMIERRIEWMARNVIVDGGFDVVDKEEGIDLHVDYNFTNKVILAKDADWLNDTVNPDELLLEWVLKVLKKSGKRPDFMLADAKTIALYLNHPLIQKKADVLNIKDARIEPKLEDNNVTFYGRISSLGLDIYSFDEWVEDDGKEEPMIPYGTVILGSTDGVGEIHFGSVTQLEDEEFVTYESEIVPKIWSDVNDDVKKLRETSRPIPAPTDVDSWAVLQVVSSKTDEEREEIGG